jgi:MoaA/NifB/PqqE/SkfB family radical SAM enzyme
MSSEFYKHLHLKKSKTFCIVPWTHLHVTPGGIAAPCCISASCGSDEGVGDSKTQGLMEMVNSEKMNQLRIDMLTGVKNPECASCHKHEEQGVTSFRQMINDELQNYYNDAVDYTNIDGSLSEFRMRYFDVRFSNICNFKCRTCGSGFSTQWEQEDLKSGVHYAKIIPKNNNKKFLNDVIDQIDYMETAYFAGGEPLITEEHYVLLEAMIKKKRNDIKLRYNTNLSNLKFKDKDLLSLWKYFKKGIDIYASIDHYGDRAEYIRHGTNWAQVEENFITVKKTPYIRVQMNTVLSVFNYLTMYDFYKYLLDKKLYNPKDSTYTLYNMSTPPHLTAHILPANMKMIGKYNMEKAIELFTKNKFKAEQIKQLSDTTPWVFSEHTWDQYKDEFKAEVKRLDSIRGEDFKKTFPELGELMKIERRVKFPV